ncbi:MAG: 2-isopropylmalate synthase [Polyangiaceae bacterium]|nr:2-isopropylmalate synthase [Polyangiaceae bacterium]
MNPKEYLHNWNAVDAPALKRVEIDDETLRDGLQSPSVTHPSVEVKRKCLRYMVDLGIQRADIGLPMSAQLSDIRALLSTIVEENLPITPGLAVRTVISDFETVAKLRDEFPSLPIKANAFLAMSRLRMWAEEWEWSQVLDRAISSVAWAKSHGVPVMFVTEDTTRSRPDDIRSLYTLAVKEGAAEVCIADTVGDALPSGARAIVRFVRGALDEAGFQGVRINWHGHSDRGMGLVNCLAAIEGGADVVHGTILGIGERSGNAQLDLLLVNLKLLGLWDAPIDKLGAYVEAVSSSTGIGVPLNYPVFGKDAFRTATGVHAAAIVKAKRRGAIDVADLVYSSVPASLVGRQQRIDVGPLSGKWCASAWLEANGYRGDDEERIAKILEVARGSGRTLESTELHAIVSGV